MIVFDGASGQYIQCGSAATLDDVATTVSFSFWMVWDGDTGGGHQVIIDKSRSASAGANGWGIWIEEANDRMLWQQQFSTTVGNWYTDANSIVAGTRYHVVVTYDKSNVANDPVIYFNGSSMNLTEATTPVGTYKTDAADNLTIGGDAAGTYEFYGKLEDVRYFNRILTSEEIQLLYAGYRMTLAEVLWLDMCSARTLAAPGTLTQGTHILPDLGWYTAHNGDPYNGPSLAESDFPRIGQHFPWVNGPINVALSNPKMSAIASATKGAYGAAITPAAMTAIASATKGAYGAAITPAAMTAIASATVATPTQVKTIRLTGPSRDTSLGSPERDTSLTGPKRDTILGSGDRHDS